MPVNPLEQYVNNQRSDFDADPPAGLWNRISEELSGTDDRDGKNHHGSGDQLTDDDLEIFVRKHRPAFEVKVPVSWSRIAEKLPASVVQLVPRSRVQKYRIVAAAAIVLLVSTLFLGREMGMRAVAHQEMAMIEAVAPDFTEMEGYYQEEIDRSFRQVSLINHDPLLKADLKAIDKSMAEIREDLLSVPKEERAALIANLIESYQIKLSILKNILNKLPTDKPQAKPENSNSHDSKSI